MNEIHFYSLTHAYTFIVTMCLFDQECGLCYLYMRIVIVIAFDIKQTDDVRVRRMSVLWIQTTSSYPSLISYIYIYTSKIYLYEYIFTAPSYLFLKPRRQQHKYSHITQLKTTIISARLQLLKYTLDFMNSDEVDDEDIFVVSVSFSFSFVVVGFVVTCNL